MQNLMDNPFQHLSAFYLIVTCSVIIGLSGCENPGSVGSNLEGPAGEIDTDTLYVEGLQAVSPVSYSGKLNYFAGGQYADPLFGDVSTTTLLKPMLPVDSVEMDGDTKVLLRLETEGSEYGDTLASQDFDIYEITELWRGAALKANDQIQFDENNPVASFTVGDEDSLTVELSSEWVDKYRQYSDTTNADSLYKYNFFGLALSPQNSGRVIPWAYTQTGFEIRNPGKDTSGVLLNQYGYTLERGGNSSIPQGSLPLYSTYEKVLNFSRLGVEDLEIKSSAISKVELVLYRNNEALEQSLESEPRSVSRPDSSSLALHLADRANTPENIDPGVPPGNLSLVLGTFFESTNSYRFDITSMVRNILQNGTADGEEFYVTLPNNGILKQELIYGNSNQVPLEKRPKIIITALKNTSNSR